TDKPLFYADFFRTKFLLNSVLLFCTKQMIGLPAAPAAAPSGGYISPTEMKKALNYIIKGVPFGGKYKISNQSGYPAFRGLMSWSINWDAKNNFEFSNNYRTYFDGLSLQK
ncbi:hypothetical protein ACLBXI_08300, partial [Bacillus cereus]